MIEPTTFTFNLNGQSRTVSCPPAMRLLDLLRLEGMLGVKEGCGEGECGACAVLMDDRLVNSCLVPALQLDGCCVTTIEGAALDRELAALQQAFVQEGGVQCGMCTPGMVLASGALLKRLPNPDEQEIREALAGNLCRCTGHVRIVKAVQRAAEALIHSGGQA